MDSTQRRTLRLLIEEHFSESELESLTHDLDIVYADLGGRGRAANIRELIDYCRRRERIPDLIELLRKERPTVAWPGESGRTRLPMLFASSDDMEIPEILVGRDALVEEVTGLLLDNERVLLVGLDGSGKTAVAQTIAQQWVDDGRGRVLWLESGDDSSDTIIERIIARFASEEEKKELGKVAGEPRLRRALRQLTARLAPLLIVLDDVWNGQAIDEIRAALPDDCPLLVTSPERFRRFHVLPVDPLVPEAALELLGFFAGGKQYQGDEDAQRLAEALGYHAYGLEIAGAHLEGDEELSPARLLEQIEHAPHNVEMPGVGRIIRKLLEHSYDLLTPGRQALLKTFGEFPNPGATSTLVSTYLEGEKPAVDRELRALARRSLLKRRGADFYEVHRLTYSYAREMAQLEGIDEARLVPAVHRYLDDHAGENALLSLDHDNMVAALQLARTADTAAMIDMVYLLARGRYFDANGHTPETLPLLDEAISLVESRDGTADEVLHWLYSKRGNEYINWGDSERGIECYEKALELASPDDAYRRAVGLSVIGRVLAEHNSPAEVDDYLERARQAAESVEEDREYAISFVLQQQSVAAHALGDNEVALRAISEAIRLSAPIAEQSPDTFGRYLMNRASYDLELAQERVRREYQRVLEMAEKAGNLNLQADAHFALGLDYHGMYKFREKAREHLLEARRLFRKVGAVVLESEVEGIIKRYGYDAPN